MQPVAERGGSDQALLRLVRSLPRGEFDFHIALPGPSPLAAEFAAAGATLHVVPMQRLSTSHGAGEWSGYVAGWPVAVARLTALARRLHVDLVHSNSLHSWYGWAAARALGRPHVVHAREIVVQSRAALRVERTLCRHFATRVIAVSYAVAAQLDPANVVVLDEYLDPERVLARPRRRASAPRVGIPDDEPAHRRRRAASIRSRASTCCSTRSRTPRTQRPELHLVIVGQPGARSGRVRRRPPRARRRHARRAAARGARRHPRRHGRSRRARVPVGRAGVVRPRAGRGAGQRHAGGRHRPRRPTRDRGPGHARHRAGRPPRATPTALAAALLELLPTHTSPERRRARLPAFAPPPPRFAELFRASAERLRLGRALGTGVHVARAVWYTGESADEPRPDRVLRALLERAAQPGGEARAGGGTRRSTRAARRRCAPARCRRTS